MTIGTKYNLGDKVWVRCGIVVISGNVVNIKTDCNYGHHNSIFYVVSPKNMRFEHITLSEWELYPTKEELLKHSNL